MPQAQLAAEPTVQSLPTTPLLTIRDFCAAHPWPTEPVMRHYIAHAEENGLGRSGAIVRVSKDGRAGARPGSIRDTRRILVDAIKFWQWLRVQGRR